MKKEKESVDQRNWSRLLLMTACMTRAGTGRARKKHKETDELYHCLKVHGV